MELRPRFRIGLLGIALESNRAAPVTTLVDFHERFFKCGDELEAYLRTGEERCDGFVATAESLGHEVVPLVLAIATSGGPCAHQAFEDIVARTLDELARAWPLDALYIHGHGAGTTTELDDLDGEYVQRLRRAVGSQLPIVMLSDFHANVSDRLVGGVNLLLGYRTNPHVDVEERAADAAVLLDRLLKGLPTFQHFIRVPMLTPQVTQLTSFGQPMGELMAAAEARLGSELLSVSLWPGFALADVPHGGFGVMAIAARAEDARAAASVIANQVWNMRDRFVARLVPLRDAVTLASTNSGSPIILADVADNPGGGARGNTTWLLEALVRAGVQGVQMGLFFDPALVSMAFDAGRGAVIDACFNSAESSPTSRPFTARAKVAALSTGELHSRRGIAAGSILQLGRTCRLDVEGVSVIVNSWRQQILSTDTFELMGLQPSAARVLVVKSRGHFRAGFSDIVPPERIFEVDLPGLTPANLAHVAWRHVTRPVWPLDSALEWSPPGSGTAPCSREA